MWYATVGVVVAVIAAGVIVGHMLQIGALMDFGGQVSMALNTAICFLLTGSAWVTHALDLRYGGGEEAPKAHG